MTGEEEFPSEAGTGGEINLAPDGPRFGSEDRMPVTEALRSIGDSGSAESIKAGSVDRFAPAAALTAQPAQADLYRHAFPRLRSWIQTEQIYRLIKRPTRGAGKKRVTSRKPRWRCRQGGRWCPGCRCTP